MVAFRSPKPSVRVRVFLLLQEIEVWCNGSTTDFGSVSLGSNPGTLTNMRQWASGQNQRSAKPSSRWFESNLALKIKFIFVDKYCENCGKLLTGRQEKFCCVACKKEKYKQEGYHSRYSAKQDENGSKLKMKYIEQLGGKCSICGYDKNVTALSFHHINPDEKGFELTSRHFGRYSLKKIEDEISKCILVCQNCHCEIHHPQYNKQ